MVFALALDSSLHHVSHHSHSCGKDLMPTWWIMLFGKSWKTQNTLTVKLTVTHATNGTSNWQEALKFADLKFLEDVPGQG
jgi:hypothetical protein